MDYQLSQKNSLFAHYQLAKQNIVCAVYAGAAERADRRRLGNNDQYNNFAIGDTYLISATE